MPQISSEPWPLCQTSVMTPQAAPTERMFRTTALAGSSGERKARASSRNVSSAISPIINGKAP